nr:MAG TPA: hypothetical protein [Caudoviricetes sp.]
MNKKFFNSMKSFATGFLCLGILATVAVFIFTAFVQVSETVGITYQYVRTSTQFNAAGLINALICLFCSIAGYFVLKGIALIGLKAYEDEIIPDTEYEKEWEESLGLNNESVSSPSKNTSQTRGLNQ